MVRLMMPIKKIDFENKTDALIPIINTIPEDIEPQEQKGNNKIK